MDDISKIRELLDLLEGDFTEEELTSFVSEVHLLNIRIELLDWRTALETEAHEPPMKQTNLKFEKGESNEP